MLLYWVYRSAGNSCKCKYAGNDYMRQNKLSLYTKRKEKDEEEKEERERGGGEREREEKEEAESCVPFV